MTEAIRLVISGDSKGAVKALDDISKKTKETSGAFGKYGAGLNKAANYGSAALVGLVGVITKSVVDYQAYGKAIRDVTRLTDISTESASTLVGQWKRFGIDATAGANGVKFFNKNLDAARQGTKTQVEAFARLGISMEELKTLDDDALLFKTRDALAEMGPGADRTAIALKLMGRGGTALMPWLNIMPKEMAEVNKQLKDAGLIWGDKQLKEYAAAVKAQREMQIALTGISQVIARDVLPALTPLVRGFGAFLRFIRPLAPALVPLTVALAAFVGVVKGANLVQQTWRTLLRLLPARIAAVTAVEALETRGVVANTVAVEANTLAKRANVATPLGAPGTQVGGKGGALGGPWGWGGLIGMAGMSAGGAGVETRTLPKNMIDELNKKYGTNYAAGGDFITRGATPFIAGEAGAERVTITPLGKSGVSRGGSQVHIHIGTVMGTDRMAAEKFATMVSDVLQRRVRYANA